MGLAEPRAGRGGWAGRAAAGLLVCFLGALAALACLAAAHRSVLAPSSHRSFPLYVSGLLHPAASWVTLGSPALEWTFAAGFLGLCAIYAALLRLRRHVGRRGLAITIAGAHLLALAGPVLLSTDLFSYLGWARTGALYGHNPYVVPPIAGPHDAAYIHGAWHHQTTPYGPLFTLMSYPLGHLGVAHGAWGMRLLVTLASLGCLALVAATAARLGMPATGALLAVGLNPVWLVYAVGGGHNDLIMVLPLLGALYLGLAGRPRPCGAVAVLGAGIKASALAAIPFLLLTAGRRRSALLGALATGLALLVLTVALFGVHPGGLGLQAAIYNRASVVGQVARLLGLQVVVPCPGGFYRCVPPGVVDGLTAGFAVALAALGWLAWRGLDAVTAAGWAMLALIAGLTSAMPWYLTWVLPFAVLSRSRALRVATVALAVFLLYTNRIV